MGLLNLFTKSAPSLLRLPSGSFTVDREGRVLMGTLPSSFPAELVSDIAQQVLTAFRDASAEWKSVTMRRAKSFFASIGWDSRFIFSISAICTSVSSS